MNKKGYYNDLDKTDRIILNTQTALLMSLDELEKVEGRLKRDFSLVVERLNLYSQQLKFSRDNIRKQKNKIKRVLKELRELHDPLENESFDKKKLENRFNSIIGKELK